MSTGDVSAGELRSGKGHRDENFPVASWLIDARHRGVILAFYEFVRVADDIADHVVLSEREKLEQLDLLEANLLGNGDDNPEAVRLRDVLAARGLPPRHAQDLLTAFRMDVTKLRYKDWDELIHYCSYSAMPVGRFVLDVHGESRATWPANDALCAALQINNHLQDCGKDFRELNRVYIPLDAFASTKARVEQLGADRASPALLNTIQYVNGLNGILLAQSEPFPRLIENTRLALEVSVIYAYARRIIAMLWTRDPLSERVHLSKAEFALHGLTAVLMQSLRRIRRASPSRRPRDVRG